MKLAARITAVLVLGTLLLMVIAEYITVRRENEEMDREMRVDASQLAATISSIVDDLWELGGRARPSKLSEKSMSCARPHRCGWSTLTWPR